ncbi:MAG: TIGR01906 family membrane protein, partial [Mogibacterium sp.]|nr:TIGR01906 family membrane protein [Mogibacterium sp.]
ALVLCLFLLLLLFRSLNRERVRKIAAYYEVRPDGTALDGMPTMSSDRKHFSIQDLYPRAGSSLTQLIARDYRRTSVVTVLAAAALGYLASKDFTKFFTEFHHIFFDNDLWLLDPAKDNLINLLPESFFRDTALTIVLFFAGMMIVTGIILALIARLTRPKPL